MVVSRVVVVLGVVVVLVVVAAEQDNESEKERSGYCICHPSSQWLASSR